MRNVTPIALDGITPRDLSAEAVPQFATVDPGELLVDDAYQRDPSGRTLALVRRIVAGWNWAKFKPPVVVRVGGRLHVLDGQHTAMAAASHPGVGEIPVLVVTAPEVVDRADAFVSHAVDRVQASPLQVHRAAVVAGDASALAIEAACRDASVVLLHAAPDAGQYRPRETVALASVRGLLSRRGADGARAVLAALAAADLAPISGNHILAADALLYDEAYAADFDAARVTAAFRNVTPAIMAEARELAAAKSLSAWRAFTATLYRRAPKRPRAKAPASPAACPAPAAPKPQGSPSTPTRPALRPTEWLGRPVTPQRGVRTFGTLAAMLMPHPELAAIVGAGPLLRSDAVEAVEKYVRTRDLLDPADRRVVVADAKLRALFGKDRVPVSELAGVFSVHAFPIFEGVNSKRR